MSWSELTKEWQAGSPTPLFPGRAELERAPLQPPDALRAHPRYEVLQAIGAGGMGVVFLARHRLMDRRVALKVLRPALLERPAAVERFQQEVRLAARLSHPNIVTALDADNAGDVHFLVMEYVEGQTLDRVLAERGRLPWQEVCAWIEQAARGLQHAGERGMVHRDLKPSNLMLTPEGTVKILDFGLGRFASEQADLTALTPADALLGTPDYLAPEQAQAPKSADTRADIYSLGCTMYHLLTGQTPFAGEPVLQQLLAHQQREPAPLSQFRSDVPPGLFKVLQRMMAKDPAQRFQTANELMLALEPFALGECQPCEGEFAMSSGDVQVVRCICGAKVSVSRRAVKAACPKCGRRLNLSAPSPAAGAATAPAQWFVAKGKNKIGPLSAAQLKQMAARGELAPSDMVLKQGQGKWSPASAINGLFAQPISATAAPAAPLVEAKTLYQSTHQPNWLLWGSATALGLAAVIVAILIFINTGSTPTKQLAHNKEPNNGQAPTANKTNGGKGKQSSTAVTPVHIQHVPADCSVAVLLRPQRLLQAPLMKKALPADLLSMADKTLGVAPSDIEEVIVLLEAAKIGTPSAPIVPPAPKDNWVTVDSKEGKFSARFPKQPKPAQQKSLLGTRYAQVAEVDNGDCEYEVVYLDLSEELAAVPLDSRLDLGTRGLEFKVGFKSKTEIKHGNLTGAEVIIDDKQLRTYAVHRVFAVGGRLYFLSVTTRNAMLRSEDTAKFFASFEVAGGGSGLGNADLFLPKDFVPMPGMIVRFTRDVDGKAILDNLLPGAKEEVVQGKKIIHIGGESPLGMPLAAYPADKRTLLIAAKSLLQKMLSADGSGPLVKRLKALDQPFDVIVLAEMDPYQEYLNGFAKTFSAMLPPPWNEAADLAAKLKALAVVCDLRGKTLLSMNLETRDEASARRLEKLGKSALDIARKTYAEWEPLLKHPVIPKAAQKDLLAIADRLVNDIEWKVTGKQLQWSLARPIPKAPDSLTATFKPYVPKTYKQEIPLAGEVADAVVGGNGRYVVYRLKTPKKFAVLDVEQGKIVKELPITEEPVFFAAGARQLAVVYPGQRMLVLWNLSTLEKEKTIPLPPPLAGEEIRQMCMGSASEGPLFFAIPRDKQTLALDLGRVTVQRVRWRHFGDAWGPENLRISADGRFLLAWGGGWAGLELARFHEGRQEEGTDQFAFSAGAFALPSADGRWVFHPDAVVGPDFKAAPIRDGGYLLPAREPGFFLSLRGGPLPFGLLRELSLPGVKEVAVFTENRVELLKLSDLDELKDGSGLHWEKTVHYYPRGGLLVTLGNKNTVVLRKLALLDQLEKAGVDYLFVFEQAAAAKPGTKLQHKLDIRSKNSSLQVKAISAPEGMKVTPNGEVVWDVPADFPEWQAPVLVSIRDGAGLEILHEFRITILPE